MRAKWWSERGPAAATSVDVWVIALLPWVLRPQYGWLRTGFAAGGPGPPGGFSRGRLRGSRRRPIRTFDPPNCCPLTLLPHGPSSLNARRPTPPPRDEEAGDALAGGLPRHGPGSPLWAARRARPSRAAPTRPSRVALTRHPALPSRGIQR